MKTKTESHLSTLFLISLFAILPSAVSGAGLVAIKEQTFHHDAGANIVVYSELKDGGILVNIETAKGTLNIDPKKIAGKIEVLSALPANITTDMELEPVRKAAKEYRDFSTRFPKSAPILTPHIAALDTCIREFEGGKGRYNGEWMPKDAALAAKLKPSEAEAAFKRKHEEKLAFEKSQKAKGLAQYDGKWLPADEVKQFVERDQIALNIAAAAVDKAQKLAASARRIKGVVISTAKEGLLVDCSDYSSAVASSSASVGGGGNVYIPSDPNGKGRPKRVEGLFFITNHPNQDSIVDKDRIDVDAVEDGVYEYTSANGAARRVKKYSVHKTYK
jgi:hypothetical protein